MPELGEVAHAVSLLRKFLLGRTIKSVVATVDEIVFVKPLDPQILSSLVGRKVTEVGRNGKYFWFECDKIHTFLLHFGMTGWIHVKDIRTHFIAMEGGGDKKSKERVERLLAEGKDPAALDLEDVPSEIWPPRFMKFVLETDEGREIAFTDPRRLGRVRLFESPASAVAAKEPLSKLGTDFSQSPIGLEELRPLIRKRKTPCKALLLDQSLFSGIGNWMADEILYQARIHPEQIAASLSDEQTDRFYAELLNVCRIAAEFEGNTAAFPQSWLMLHRWGKGRKEKQKTADGYIVEQLKVGGRTSSYVPELQKLISVENLSDGLKLEDNADRTVAQMTERSRPQEAKRSKAEAIRSTKIKKIKIEVDE